MLHWDEATFTSRMQGSPMRRLKLHRFKRNICVVIGNVGTTEDIPALQQVLRAPDVVVQEHARWAIRQIENRVA